MIKEAPPFMQLDNYRPSQEVLRLVAQIDEFKGAWRRALKSGGSSEHWRGR
jgi:hypothetical protein